MNAVQEIAGLPRDAARMLAVEILLAEPESLGDDVLESCLYIPAGETEGDVSGGGILAGRLRRCETATPQDPG
jgi:hypothetical protein